MRIPLKVIPALASLALLGAVAAETLSRPRPKDAEPYHLRVRQAKDAVPMRIGNWEGRDFEVPAGAIALLKPNALLKRDYVDRTTGRRASFLLVQCRDANDLNGHYPPICYRSQGWEPLSSRPMEWNLGGRIVKGMEYEYTQMHQGQSVTLAVSNLIIMPDGRFGRGMDEVREAAADYLRRFYGAAQIQVVVDASMPFEERVAVFKELVGANLPLIDALTSGGRQ